jgi:competence CoiA-like predicted nuclease
LPLFALLERELIHADRALRGPVYNCRFCPSEMILKRGEVRIPHFAHRASQSCISLHKPESEFHLKLKKRVHEFLKGSELEVRIGDHVFDVVHNQFIFECQVSAISLEEMHDRERCAQEHDKEIVWVFGSPPYGVAWHTRQGEVTRVKAAELMVNEKGDMLRYCDERGIFFERELTKPAPRAPHEFNDESECKTKWFFEESDPGIEEVLGIFID